MAEANFRLPPPLNVNDSNLADTFKKWKRQFEIYMVASGAVDKENKTKTAILLHCAGPQILDVYDTFTFANDEEKNDPAKVLEKLEVYCNPRQNEVLESHRFWTTPYQPPFDKFLTELRVKVESCNYGDQKDRMIRDKIVFTVDETLQELLMRDIQLNLKKAINTCRAYEQSKLHVKELCATPSPSIHKVYENKKKQHGQTSNPQKQVPRQNKTGGNGGAKRKPNNAPPQSGECKFCGYNHEWVKTKCPAWGKTCDLCKGRNHFKSKCKKVHAIHSEQSVEHDYDEDDRWLAAVQSPGEEHVTALMKINGCDVRFQLDSAADVNTVCKQYVKQAQVKSTTTRLIMWNKSKMQPLGEADLEVTNPRTNETRVATFTVVPNGFQCLLGLKTVKEMGLITIHNDKFVAKVQSTQLGDLGEVSLQVDPSIPPKALPCRKIPLAVMEEVKQEVDRLVAKEVLVPVKEPTKWVSQTAVVRKPNGKLRFCIDPQPLNLALMREHYRLSTIDDVLPMLSKARVFSKLDVKDAFWHVKLDQDSSLLTTMITPFGRYRWTRLPFGLKVSSEIFQRKLNEAIGDLDGVFVIADDIIVAGCGETHMEAVNDNQTKLNKLYERCKERNVILNDEKKDVCKSEITVHGHRFTSEGVKVDTKKVEAVCAMPPPADELGVKRLCGMVQYMAKFMPNLASDLEPIRALTRQNVEWNWSEECNLAFNRIKEKLTQTPVLSYFNPEKKLLLQVDSSKDGLGAVLLQEGRPIEYASRALTSSERNWAQIEKETLSMVFGLERFDQYTYGRPVTVQNDHKPLASILKKPLSQAPRRIQALMMRLYRYDIEFQYMEGSRLILADTLSRAFLNENENDVSPRILSMNSLIDMPDPRIEEVQQAMKEDNDLQILLKTIKEGWPDKKEDVPLEIRAFYDVRDVLSHQDGIILKGERILIPRVLRDNMKKRLHAAHLGYDSMMRRARNVIYWPGMSQEIKQVADTCEACQQSKPKNQKETLKQHEEGTTPWNKIGIDLFEIDKRIYMVTIDYYSNFIEIEYMSSTTTSSVVTVLKKQFARFGIPTTIISDGGPQLSSQEFDKFVKDWGIRHSFSSPAHQQANGKAEAAVKIMKNLMRKSLQEGNDPYMALLEQRNTPRQDTDLSPAQMMFGHHTRSILPMIANENAKQDVSIEKRSQRRATVKKWHDKRARDMSVLQPGQSVYFQHKEKKGWIPGTVIGNYNDNDRTYIVQANGVRYRRNRIHMRPTQIIHNEPQVRVQQNVPAQEVEPQLPQRPGQPAEPVAPAIVPANPNVEVPIQPLVNPEVPNNRPVRNRTKPQWLKDYVQ